MDSEESVWIRTTRWIALFFVVSGLLRVVALLLFIYDWWWWTSSYKFLFGSHPLDGYTIVFGVVVALGFILSGWGLLRRHHWARIGGIVFSLFLMPDFPVGTIMAGVFIAILVAPQVSNVYGRVIESARPYRVAGIALTLVGVMAIVTTTGMYASVSQDLDYRLRGFPTCGLSPMEKVGIAEDDMRGQMDVMVFLSAPLGTQAIRQQSLVVQDIQMLGGIITGSVTRCHNALRATMTPEQIRSLAASGNVRSIVRNDVVGYIFDGGEVDVVHGLRDVHGLVDTSALWGRGLDGDNVVVAVMDTGINPRIGAFQRNGESVVIAEYELYGDYVHWHGTAVASCIVSQDGVYPGVAPHASVIDVAPFQIIGGEPGMTLSDALWGFDRIVEWKETQGDGYKVISSNSWGVRQDAAGAEYVTEAANNVARYHGIPVVVAAGNNEPVLCSPSDGGHVLCVAAVDKNRDWAAFSCMGPGRDEDKKPDVSAPGVSITMFDHTGSLITASGTSFATPIVSGLMACVMEERRDYSPRDYYQAFQYSADDIDRPGFDYRTGYGFVDALEAYEIIGTIESHKSRAAIAFSLMLTGLGIVFYPEWGGLVLRGDKGWPGRKY